MNIYFKPSHALSVLMVYCIATRAFALPEVIVEIKDHLFYPQEVVVPAGRKVRLTFVNFDDSPEEIDSFALNREKVIFSHSSGSIYIGPLTAGEYPFFGEYHPNSAVGKVIVIEEDSADAD